MFFRSEKLAYLVSDDQTHRSASIHRREDGIPTSRYIADYLPSSQEAITTIQTTNAFHSILLTTMIPSVGAPAFDPTITNGPSTRGAGIVSLKNSTSTPEPSSTNMLSLSTIAAGNCKRKAETNLSVYTLDQQRSISFVPTACPHPSAIGRNCAANSAICDMLQPCQNDGTCSESNITLLGFICSCVSGVNGTRCELDYRPCKPNTCWNDGTYSTTPDDRKAFSRLP